MTDDQRPLDRIDSGDWPALEAFARIRKQSIEDAAVDFEDQYLGEWPTILAFIESRLVWEYDIPEQILPFLDTTRYMEFLFSDAFWSVGHANGDWIFQIGPEPDSATPNIPTLSDEAVE